MFFSRTLACYVFLTAPLLLASHAQQPEAPDAHQHAPAHPSMDPNMQMGPQMQMDPNMPGMNHPQAAPAGPAHQHDSRPITEPTIPPVGYGEPAMHMHMQDIPHVQPRLPVIGRSKHPESSVVYQLDDLEQRALKHNPTLAQAQRSIEEHRGIRRQVGLNPNPIVGYYGDEIRGGSFRSGKQGFFIDQPVILGGKLGLNRRIEDASIEQVQAAAEAQRYRVVNDTRQAYYSVLTEQELVNIKQDLLTIAHQTMEYTHELGNTGQADESEILQVETAEEQMRLAVDVEKNRLTRAWVRLSSVVGDSHLPIGAVAGDLEDLPHDTDDDKLLSDLLAHSPEVQFAQAEVAKAEAMLKRAQRDNFPDLSAKGGLAQNNEPLSTPQSRVGLVGYAEIGVQLHLFDRNQGNIDADRAGVSRAEEELQRIELSLRDRFAASADTYKNAKLIALRYREQILPRTQRAYVLMTRQYGMMDASYARVLNLQREMYTAEVDYLEALGSAHRASVVLQGFLYTGGTLSSAHADAGSGSVEQDPIRSSTTGRMPSDLNAPNAQQSIFNNGLEP